MAEVTVENMAELIMEYEEYLRSERMRRPNTVKRYLDVVRQFSSFLHQDSKNPSFPLESVDKNHLVRFLRRESRKSDQPSKGGFY